jgi:O-antigen/teichoic acid export membrane protein
MQIRNPRGMSQNGRMSFLLKDSVIYGGAAAISKSFSIITFPVIARHFSTAEYGIIDLFGVVATFIGILVVFGQDSAVAPYFYEHEDTDVRRQLISQSLLI